MDGEEKDEFQYGLKLLVKSSFVFFVGIMLSKIISYGYRVVIARYFGPEDYGVINLAVMIAGWVGAIGLLGLADGITRFIPFYRGKKEYGKIKYIVKTSLVIAVFTSVICSSLLFVFADFISERAFHSEKLAIFLKIFSAIIPLSLFGNIFLGVIQAFEKISWYSFITNILQNALRLLGLVLFIFIGLGSNSIAYSYIVGAIGVLAVSYYACKKDIPIIFEKNNQVKDKKIVFNELLSYSWPLMFYGVFAYLFTWTDSFFLGLFENVRNVGIYNAAIPIGLLLIFAPELFSKLFFPLITKEYAKGKMVVIDKLTKQLLKWVLMINMPVFLIMVIFPGVFINVLFGSEYLAAEVPLRILALGFLVVSVSNNLSYLINMKGKSKLLLMNTIIVGVINVVLNLILIPAYGMTGAAISSCISYLSFGLLIFIEAYNLTNIIPFHRDMIKIFLVSLIPTGIVLLMRSAFDVSLWLLIFSGIIFIGVYFMLLVFAKCIDENDKMILRTVWGKGKRMVGIK